MRLIKKYKNRRLYDTEKSQYITIEDLRNYVVSDVLFSVEDAATKKDITSATLLQILVEMETGPSKFLSADLLKQLICLAQHPMHQTFKAMVEQLVANIDEQMKSNPYLADYQQANQTWNQQMQQMFEQWQTLFRKPR